MSGPKATAVRTERSRKRSRKASESHEELPPSIASLPTRSPPQELPPPPIVDRPQRLKRPKILWTEEEDKKLVELVHKLSGAVHDSALPGNFDWPAIASELGTGRSQGSVAQHWNTLRQKPGGSSRVLAQPLGSRPVPVGRWGHSSRGRNRGRSRGRSRGRGRGRGRFARHGGTEPEPPTVQLPPLFCAFSDAWERLFKQRNRWQRRLCVGAPTVPCACSTSGALAPVSRPRETPYRETAMAVSLSAAAVAPSEIDWDGKRQTATVEQGKPQDPEHEIKYQADNDCNAGGGSSGGGEEEGEGREEDVDEDTTATADRDHQGDELMDEDGGGDEEDVATGVGSHQDSVVTKQTVGEQMLSPVVHQRKELSTDSDKADHSPITSEQESLLANPPSQLQQDKIRMPVQTITSSSARRWSSKPVLSRLIGSDGEWDWHESGTQAGIALGVDKSNISKVCTGKTNFLSLCGGYEFKFAKPDARPAAAVSSAPGNHMNERQRATSYHGGSKPVLSRLIGSDGEWDWHESGTQAGITLGVDKVNISKVCTGKMKFLSLCGGYEFKFAKPDARPAAALGNRTVELQAVTTNAARVFAPRSFANSHRCHIRALLQAVVQEKKGCSAAMLAAQGSIKNACALPTVGSSIFRNLLQLWTPTQSQDIKSDANEVRGPAPVSPYLEEQGSDDSGKSSVLGSMLAIEQVGSALQALLQCHTETGAWQAKLGAGSCSQQGLLASSDCIGLVLLCAVEQHADVLINDLQTVRCCLLLLSTASYMSRSCYTNLLPVLLCQVLADAAETTVAVDDHHLFPRLNAQRIDDSEASLQLSSAKVVPSTVLHSSAEIAVCQAWLRLVRALQESKTGHKQAVAALAQVEILARRWERELYAVELGIAVASNEDVAKCSADVGGGDRVPLVPQQSRFEHQFRAHLALFATETVGQLRARMQDVALVRRWAAGILEDLDAKCTGSFV